MMWPFRKRAKIIIRKTEDNKYRYDIYPQFAAAYYIVGSTFDTVGECLLHAFSECGEREWEYCVAYIDAYKKCTNCKKVYKTNANN